MDDLTGVGARCEQRVISELGRAAVFGTLLGLADDFADRRVNIDLRTPTRLTAKSSRHFQSITRSPTDPTVLAHVGYRAHLSPGMGTTNAAVELRGASINSSGPSRSAIVAVNNNPAFATRFGSSNDTSMRVVKRHNSLTGSVSRFCRTMRCRNQHRPSPGDLSGGYAHHFTPKRSVDRGLNLRPCRPQGLVGSAAQSSQLFSIGQWPTFLQ